MPNTQEVIDWKGQKLVSQDGDKIGTIDEVYVDEQTGEPEWLAVSTGLFGSRVSFVPLAEAQRDGDDIRVPYDQGPGQGQPQRGGGRRAVAGRGVPAVPALRARLLGESLGLRPAGGQRDRGVTGSGAGSARAARRAATSPAPRPTTP